METSPASYGGGAGGKLRRRPLHRPPSTPYDRPPSAARGLRVSPAAAAEKKTFLSKLVDPASRVIARSASRFFSSVFRKQLPAPPAAPEEDLQSSQEVHAVFCTNPSLEVQEQGGCGAENTINNFSSSGVQQKRNSDTDGVFELEQLLKQKTFTRVEFDRLAGLLHSRTMEQSMLPPVFNCKREENSIVLGQENGLGCIGSNGNISSSAIKVTMPEEEFASPAELAQAYMGSEPSKMPSSTLSFRNQIFRENTTLPSNASYKEKGSNLSIVPRSSVRFSGTPEVSGNGCVTPRPIGRSAMHRLSQSPYFKAPSATSVKGGEPYGDNYAGSLALSQWTPASFMHSDGKQAHKRGSSVLYGDFGSSGPIRRIRQKSNLMSPSKDIHSLVARNVPPPSTLLDKIINHELAASIQEPLCSDGLKTSSADSQHAGNGENKVPLASVVPITPQSSEMKWKTLQQLDKPVSSPKGRSSEHRAISRDELPSKLTVNMLHERALKSMEDIDSSKFFNLQSSGNLDAPSDSNAPSLRSSISPKKLSAEDNIPSTPAFSGIKATPDNVGLGNPVKSATNGKAVFKMVDFVISGSDAVPSPKKPAFQMTAPEDALDMDDDDDDDYITRDASHPFTTGNDIPEPNISECKAVISGTPISEKSLVSSENLLASGSMLNREAPMKASKRPVTGEDTGFSFHVAPVPSTSSQPPSTPTMPSPLLDRSAPPKEQIAAPGFIFGSKEPHSATTKISDSARLEFSPSNATTTLPEGSDSDGGGKRPKAGDIFKSSGNTASSSVSTLTFPELAAFGATTPTLSNGPQNSTSSTFSVSAAAALPFANNLATSTLSTRAVTTTCSSSLSISSAPMFSTVPSGASTGATSIVSPSMDKSNFKEPEGMPVKASPFRTDNAIALGTSTAFLNTSSNSSVLAASSVSSSTSFLAATSSLFSSSGSSSSALSVPSTFSNTGSDIFGFSAPAQSRTLNLSVSNSSSQDSTTTFDTTVGSTFGTEATQVGNGISKISQATVSQFGSFSSSPSFGLTGSSSLGSGSLPFGLATSDSKTFGSSTGLSFPTGAGSSTSVSSSSFAPMTTTSSSSSTPQTSTFPIFGSSTSSSKGFLFGQSAPSSSSQQSTPIFGSSTSLQSTGLSFEQIAPASSSQPSSSSVFGSSTSSPSTGVSFGQSAPISSFPPSSSSIFGSSTSSPSTGFSFGQSSPTLTALPSTPSIFGSSTSSTTTGFTFGPSAITSGSSSFPFGASSGSAFSFTSAGTTSSSALVSPPQPVFGLPTLAAGFTSASPGNDQMNVEDSMADDTIQAASTLVPSFGQPASSLATPSLAFGSPAVPSGGPSVFQFGNQQNSSVTQSSSPFQTGGNLEFSAGGSFSLGSGGGDKSGRKIVRINRNKHRKK